MINNIFKNLRENFILIGLTGVVCSSRTTTANILTKKYKDFEIENILKCDMKKTNWFY